LKAEPVSSKLRTHVQKELDRGAESHSQLQMFPFLCATLYNQLYIAEQEVCFCYIKFFATNNSKMPTVSVIACERFPSSGKLPSLHWHSTLTSTKQLGLWEFSELVFGMCSVQISSRTPAILTEVFLGPSTQIPGYFHSTILCYSVSVLKALLHNPQYKHHLTILCYSVSVLKALLHSPQYKHHLVPQLRVTEPYLHSLIQIHNVGLH
jgi:hypothetical protein